MDKRIIETLSHRAREIADKLAKHLGGHWEGYSWEEDLNIEIPTEGQIRFERKKDSLHARVIFTDISPAKVIDKEMGEPVLLGTTIQDVQSSVIRNESEDIDVDRDYSVTIEETTTTTDEVGVTVGLELRQMFGYGGELSPVSGETEITASVETAFTKSWEAGTTAGRETSTSISVPPMTEATVTTQRSLKNFEQTSTFTAGIEHKVSIWSDDKYRYDWDSVAELRRTLKGESPSDIALGDHFRKNPASEGDIYSMTEPKNTIITFDKTVKFDKAVSGDVSVTSKEI